MTKQRIGIYVGQRVRYAGKAVTIIGKTEAVDKIGSQLRYLVRDDEGVEMYAHPKLVEPLGRPSARRGRVTLGYIEREFKKAKAEAEKLESELTP
jgi:rRNA processing protein Krr1/Pno1